MKESKKARQPKRSRNDLYKDLPIHRIGIPAKGEASAVVWSLAETAAANNLNVYQYLYMVLLYMPDYKDEPAGIKALLQWNPFIKEHCSGLRDTETITLENHPELPLSGEL